MKNRHRWSCRPRVKTPSRHTRYLKSGTELAHLGKIVSGRAIGHVSFAFNSENLKANTRTCEFRPKAANNFVNFRAAATPFQHPALDGLVIHKARPEIAANRRPESTKGKHETS